MEVVVVFWFFAVHILETFGPHYAGDQPGLVGLFVDMLRNFLVFFPVGDMGHDLFVDELPASGAPESVRLRIIGRPIVRGVPVRLAVGQRVSEYRHDLIEKYVPGSSVLLPHDCPTRAVVGDDLNF